MHGCGYLTKFYQSFVLGKEISTKWTRKMTNVFTFSFHEVKINVSHHHDCIMNDGYKKNSYQINDIILMYQTSFIYPVKMRRKINSFSKT